MSDFVGNGSAIICFSHLRWSFVYQRPQHLMSRAARTYSVLYFEEPVYEADSDARLDIRRDCASSVRIAVPVLPEGIGANDAITLLRKLLTDLVRGMSYRRLIAWYYTPMALEFSIENNFHLCIYDNMDELSAFAGAPPEMRAFERALLSRANVVFTGGQSLYEAKRDLHPNVHAFPSSVDAAHFARARTYDMTAEPEDQAAIQKPRLGYFGVIDERLDLKLLFEFAQLRPDWQIVMIGPVAKISPASLPRLANIHWLGGKSYEDLPHYLAGWDVGLMPFAMNQSTRFISPTKTPEFLAAGIPVVSTAVVDVVRTYGSQKLVEIAKDAGAFVRKSEALLKAPRQEWLRRVDRQLGTGSWDLTWQRMDTLLHGQAAAHV